VFAFVLAYVVSAIFVLFSKKHNPGGYETDRSHIWVWVGTHNKVKDASEKDVYEHYHGHGSWEQKVRGEQRGIVIFGCILAVAIPLLLGRICSIHGLLKPIGLLSSITAGIVAATACFTFLASLPPMTYSKMFETSIYKPIPEMSLGEMIFQLIVWALVFVIQPLSALACVGHLWFFPDSWHGWVEHAIYSTAFWLFLEIALLQLAVALVYLFSKEK
jgi:hypothetical protein